MVPTETLTPHRKSMVVNKTHNLFVITNVFVYLGEEHLTIVILQLPPCQWGHGNGLQSMKGMKLG